MTALYLVLLAGVPELLLRQPQARQLLGVGSVGSTNVELDVKAVDIDYYAHQSQPIDCLIIGASDIDAAINPTRLQTHHCYNFGVGGIRSNEAMLILDVLLNKYDIKLLIVGASAQFMIDGVRNETVVENSRWVCCYNGQFNMAGWLAHHSAAYQYGQLGMVWLRDPILYAQLREYAGLIEVGYAARRGTIRDSDPEFSQLVEDVATRNQRILQAAENGSLPNRRFIEYLVGLQARGIRVIALRPPIRPQALTVIAKTQDAIDLYNTSVVPQFEEAGILFLEPSDEVNLPNTHWRDFVHMNVEGANVFTDWLDSKLSDLDTQ